ncbi:hypothetical protein BGX24_008268, partial [Mortierella sp. AD032]
TRSPHPHILLLSLQHRPQRSPYPSQHAATRQRASTIPLPTTKGRPTPTARPPSHHLHVLDKTHFHLKTKIPRPSQNSSIKQQQRLSISIPLLLSKLFLLREQQPPGPPVVIILIIDSRSNPPHRQRWTCCSLVHRDIWRLGLTDALPLFCLPFPPRGHKPILQSPICTPLHHSL